MTASRDSRQGGVQVLLLAAGSGRRFGTDKLTRPIRGRPLIAHVAAALAEAAGGGALAGGVAVVSPGATPLIWALDAAGLDLVENPDPAAGLSRSLQLGLEVLTTRDAGAALITLADQPLLTADVIGRLVREWRATARSVRPRYAGHPETPGHPVLLDRSWWHLAAGLSGDGGFGPLLARPEAEVTIIDVPGANPDVDTLDDLRRLEDGA